MATTLRVVFKVLPYSRGGGISVCLPEKGPWSTSVRRFGAKKRQRGRRVVHKPVTAPPTPTPQNKTQPPTTLPFAHALVGVVGAGAVFVIATGTAYIAAQPQVDAEEAEKQQSLRCSCAQRVKVFDGAADSYDDSVGTDELLMGLPLLRRWLLRRAQGDVLEVAAGTGVNLPLYPKRCKVTATDASAAMLKRARTKAGPNVVAFARVDVESGLGMEVGGLCGGPFDTVVDAFGLCSVDDPVAALRHMQRACRPDGRILLLEHGRAHYDWLNALLDRHAAKHLAKWGCNWNRDVLAVIHRSGARVESLSRWHFGTTYVIVAKPDPALAAPPKNTPSS